MDSGEKILYHDMIRIGSVHVLQNMLEKKVYRN